MPFTFPILSSGSMRVVKAPLSSSAIAMYPAAFGFNYVSRVIKFLNDNEQRWVVRGQLFTCVIQYHGVNGYDFNLIRAFFNDMDGMYVTPDLLHSFSITIDGNTWDHCAFDQDALYPTVGRGETYSFELKIRQVAPNGAAGG